MMYTNDPNDAFDTCAQKASQFWDCLPPPKYQKKEGGDPQKSQFASAKRLFQSIPICKKNCQQIGKFFGGKQNLKKVLSKKINK